MSVRRPEVIWAEAAAHAVLSAAVPSLAGSGFTVDGASLVEDDTGDGWFAIGWVEGGRAVLYGFRPYGSRIHAHVPPVDPFAGGPDWLPWERLIATPMLAFLHWWDGSSWAQAPLPEIKDHGAGYTSGTVEDLYLELGEDYDALGEANRRLVDAAEQGAVDRPVIEALLAPLDEEGDVEAALRIAARTGVAPGSSRPELAAGTGEPPGRRVPIFDPDQIGGVITVGMRDTDEVERPAAVAGPARARLVEWARTHGEITAAYVGHARPGFAYRDARGQWLDPEPSELLTAWREEDADPARGRWLHARVRADADGAVVECFHDHLPAWWESGFMPDAQVEALRAEMRQRDPRWRPGWAELLDRDFMATGVPPRLCWRPSLRWSGEERDVARMLRSGTLSSAPLEVWQTARPTLVELARAEPGSLAALIAAEPTGGERLRQAWLGALADAGAGGRLPVDWFAGPGARCPASALRKLMKQAAVPPREGLPVPRALLDVAQPGAWPLPDPRRDGQPFTGSTDFAAMATRPPVARISRFVRDIGRYGNVDYTDILGRVWAALPGPLRELVDGWRTQTEAGGLPALEAGLAYLAPLAAAGFADLDPGFLSGWAPTDPVDALVRALRTGIPGELEFPFAEKIVGQRGTEALVVQHGDYLTVVTHPARVYGTDGELLTRRVTMPELFPEAVVHPGPVFWYDGTDLRMADRTGVFRLDGYGDDHGPLLTFDADAAGPDYPETAEVTFPGADHTTRIGCGGGRLRFHAADGTETAQAPFGVVQHVQPGAHPVPPPGWWRHMRPVDPAGSAALRRIDRVAAGALAEAALLGPREADRRLGELLPAVTDPRLRAAVVEQAGLAARCLHGVARLGAGGLPAVLTPGAGLRVRRNIEVVTHGRLLAGKLVDALTERPGLVGVTDVPTFDRRRLPFLELGSRALSIVWPWITAHQRAGELDELHAWACTPFADGSGHWSRMLLDATERFDRPEGEIWHLSGSALVILDYDNHERRATGIRYAPDPDADPEVPPGWQWAGQFHQNWGSPDTVRRFDRLLAERGPLSPDPAFAVELADRTGMSRRDAAHAVFGSPGRTVAELAALRPPEIVDLYLDPATGQVARARISDGTAIRLRELMMSDDPWTTGLDIARAATWQNGG
ncbi:hypothetical protein [Virgisporangium aurantiacum]|uniref:Uncharacterized protein n=1 Tax=Virgisporangium aurantiacum TaxID=175570 RepID=A0A8J4E2A5_9ACTN|nr:hypothetical protein [Virgisporangium aurantiacum]GIJ56832.1 hypothetical protein Vau01_043480 [Virgisporangium aurantiacum]